MEHIIHPIITGNNYCTHCGAENTLRYIDLHDESHSQMIYVTSKAKCEKCGAEFFIHWQNKNGNMAPYYSSKDIINDFYVDISTYAKQHRRKLL